MDYILFHSQYSSSSVKLIEEFPSIVEKGVLVDSIAMRNYVKQLRIVCVPTLVVILDNKIVERIMGFENVRNWLIVTIYRVNKLQPLEPEPEPEMEYARTFVQSEEPMSQPIQEREPQQESTTSLDNLILEDVVEERDTTTPHVQMGLGANTMQLAEAMKKERDNNLDSGNKKKFGA